VREDRTAASARGRLAGALRAGLLERREILVDAPALYTATRAGTRLAGLPGLVPAHVSVANAPHTTACVLVAATLERAYPRHRVMGERELRGEERAAGRALASARLGACPNGASLLHRPDLVLWPKHSASGKPVAVEVELSVKAPRRLAEICRGWARCAAVAGTLYLAAPDVLAPLARAIERAQAERRVSLVPLRDLADLGERGRP
jgi:hypothetical protein